jgi:hypothetical protein
MANEEDTSTTLADANIHISLVKLTYSMGVIGAACCMGVKNILTIFLL